MFWCIVYMVYIVYRGTIHRHCMGPYDYRAMYSAGYHLSTARLYISLYLHIKLLFHTRCHRWVNRLSI